MNVVAVVNQGAGNANARVFVEITRRLPDVVFKLPREGESIEAIARDVVKGKPDVVIAVGGDGTVNAVAQAVVGTDITLGVVPTGTFNHFARDVGLPFDVDRALDVIVAGRTREIDVGEVNGRIFLNNSSQGLYPQFAMHRDALRQTGQRWLALIRSAVEVLKRVPLLDVQIDVGGARMRRRTALVFVGNNEYRAQRRGIGGRDRLDGGELCLFVAHDTGSRGLFRLASRAVLLGLKYAFDDARATEIRIATGKGQDEVRVAVDGEVVSMRPPLHYRIRPRALRVLVP